MIIKEKLKMKKITSILIGLCLSSTVLAAPTSMHPISVYNQTAETIWYTIDPATGEKYGIKSGESDTYRTKGRNSSGVTVQTGKCNRIGGFFSMCTDAEKGSNCVNNQYYDGDAIQSVTVIAFNSCIVTCTDGSYTSCKK